jgi:ABC-type uncharacterized transport system substrate-binding protein
VPGAGLMMIHRLVLTVFGVLIAFGVCLVAAPGRGEAHPHVWVMVTAEVLYAPDGSVTGVRQDWTFDEMFSTFATHGVKQKTQGVFAPEELAPLARVYIDGLKDYGYFTHAKLDGQQRKDAFADPTDYSADYDTKETALTLHFTLPFKAPVAANALAIEIYDPQLFFYLSFAKSDPVRLIGAPAQCAPAVKKSEDGDSPATGHIAGMIATSTSQIWVKCP